MSQNYFTEKDFSGIETIETGEYEDCTFKNCNFSNADLTDINFAECTFEQCDLSMAKIVNTIFRDAKFENCKLLGLHFENCNELLFSADFEGCQLNLSSFYKRSMKNTNFKNCNLQEVDFTEADLSNSVFENCDLTNATFEHTTLMKSDFRSSFNYSIDPELNRIKKAKFSLTGITGLLDKYEIEIE